MLTKLMPLALCAMTIAGMTGCAVYADPPARPVGVAYVAPVGVAPGPGYEWRWHHAHGWGWWHPHRGWQYGWR
ncbi:hypothetical protein [Reyranella sp.]|jgi:hypothetical protein|uniref:hypothetical protein n=1 Tax=Reyranella sp. TaxID=1929291 RepID=UPI002F944BDE